MIFGDTRGKLGIWPTNHGQIGCERARIPSASCAAPPVLADNPEFDSLAGVMDQIIEGKGKEDESQILRKFI